jgi:hypothetical protein
MGQPSWTLENLYGLHFTPSVTGRLRVGPRCVAQHHRLSEIYLRSRRYVPHVFTCHGANAWRKLVERLDLSYRTPRELNGIIDNNLPGPPPFQCRELDIGHERLQFYCRDALQSIQSLYGDPEFVQNLVFAPEQHYTDNERTCRVINEMHTGDWWWNIQVRNMIYIRIVT